MQKFKLYNIETGEYATMTVPEILEEINRDRSDKWTDYDASDWQEGLSEFTEWELVEEEQEQEEESSEDDRSERDCQRESDLMAYYRER
jgi:hypothetical protein